MQHSHTSELGSEGHHALWTAVKYLLLAAVVLLAVIEFSTGTLITLLFAVGLILALMERVQKIDGQQDSQVFQTRLIGDGGSFPNAEPEMKKTYSQSVSVLDGGSFERNPV